MTPKQVWSRDSAGNPVYWTGTAWILPQWNRDSAGRPVFWSPQHNQWLHVEFPEGQTPSASNPNHDTSHVSKASGKRPVPAPATASGYQSTGIPQLPAGAGTSSIAAMTSNFASMAIEASSASGTRPTLKWQTNNAGVTEYIVSSSSEGVQSKFYTGPADRITEPQARAQGLSSSKYFTGTDETSTAKYERLDERYKIRKQSGKFFKLGRVFMMLHPEPAGDTRSAVTPVTRDARYGEEFYISPRRFVVVTTGEYSCTTIAIWTYGYQGVAKKGVIKSHHAVVFSGRTPPDNVPIREELPVRGEEPMKPQKIRVNMHDEADALHPMSRINFAKVYTIEHNVKVRDLGEVNPKSMADLWSVFRAVQNANAAKHGPQPSNVKAGTSSRARTDSVSGPSYQKPAEEEEESDDGDEEDDDDEEEEDDESDDSNEGNNGRR